MYESVKYDMLIYFLIEKIDCPAWNQKLFEQANEPKLTGVFEPNL